MKLSRYEWMTLVALFLMATAYMIYMYSEIKNDAAKSRAYINNLEENSLHQKEFYRECEHILRESLQPKKQASLLKRWISQIPKID